MLETLIGRVLEHTRPKEHDVTASTSRHKGIRRRANGKFEVRFNGQGFGLFDSESEAIVRRAQIEIDLEAGRRPRRNVRHDPTLADAVKKHVAHRERDCRNGLIAASTLRELRRCLNAWLPDTKVTAVDEDGYPFAGERLAQLSLPSVAEWFEQRYSQAPTQARNELFALKAVLRDATRFGATFPVGLLTMSARRPPRRIGKALTPAELELLAGAFPERLRTLPLLLGTVGLRIGEALPLTRNRVDLGRGTVLIPAEMCKERREKTVPLNDEELALFEEQLACVTGSPYVWPRVRGGLWGHWHFHSRVWQPAIELAGDAWRVAGGDDTASPYDGLRIHDLRHTAATLMRKAGVPHDLIAFRLGHNDSGAMVEKIYNHPDPDELIAEFRQVAGSSIREAVRQRAEGLNVVPLTGRGGRRSASPDALRSPREQIVVGHDLAQELAR